MRSSFVDNPDYTPEQRVAMQNWHARIDAENAASEQRRRAARDPIGGFFAFLQLLWHSIFRMGMYSSDPHLAQVAIVHTVDQELRNQRQIAVVNRAEDQARDEQRMRTMARVMAEEMFDEADRRRR